MADLRELTPNVSLVPRLDLELFEHLSGDGGQSGAVGVIQHAQDLVEAYLRAPQQFSGALGLLKWRGAEGFQQFICS